MTHAANAYSSKLNAPVKNRSFGLKYFNYGLFVLVGILGVSYLINISNLTVQGFVLRDLKSQATVVASEKTENEEKVNLAQSYYSLNSRTKNLQMVAVGDVEYLNVPGATVAKK